MAQEKQPRLRAIESRFSELLMSEFEAYCSTYKYDRHNKKVLLDYLLDHNILNTKAVRDFTIKLEFKQMAQDQKNKTNTVTLLSNKYGISTRSIWLTLRQLNEDKRDWITKR